MLNKSIYLIGLAFALTLFSCCPQKNIGNSTVATSSQNKAKLSEDYKEDSTVVAYTEKLINEAPITDLKGSFSVEKLSKLLPNEFGDYTARPLSSSKMKEDSCIIVVVKGQYIKKDNTVVTVDITDYSPQKKVLKPEIFDTNIPEIENFDTKPYLDRGGKGYVTWNSVKNMGWLNLLYGGRFNIKIRAHGPSASIELMNEFLSKIDTKIIEAQ